MTVCNTASDYQHFVAWVSVRAECCSELRSMGKCNVRHCAESSEAPWDWMLTGVYGGGVQLEVWQNVMCKSPEARMKEAPWHLPLCVCVAMCATRTMSSSWRETLADVEDRKEGKHEKTIQSLSFRSFPFFTICDNRSCWNGRIWNIVSMRHLEIN